MPIAPRANRNRLAATAAVLLTACASAGPDANPEPRIDPPAIYAEPVAIEFGHILGLGHCLDCDSAMNYSWHTRDRVFVTQTDVEAVVGLFDDAGARPR